MKNIFRVAAILLLSFFAILGVSTRVEAAPYFQGSQDGATIFQQKCAGCHSIGGGKLVGPDLAGVADRRDPAWLKQFITDPAALIAAGDPTAADLVAQYKMTMPTLGLPASDVDALVAYFASRPTSAPVAAAALPAGSTANGQMLFSGAASLSGGGPSCIACHTVSGVGALHGGSLGPDLTNVVQRLGEPGLVASLSNIAFPTMQGVFVNNPLSPQEQADLVAYFKWANTSAPPPNPALTAQMPYLFLGIGVVGALVLLGVLVFFWPRQRTPLSEQLRRLG